MDDFSDLQAEGKISLTEASFLDIVSTLMIESPKMTLKHSFTKEQLAKGKIVQASHNDLCNAYRAKWNAIGAKSYVEGKVASSTVVEVGVGSIKCDGKPLSKVCNVYEEKKVEAMMVASSTFIIANIDVKVRESKVLVLPRSSLLYGETSAIPQKVMENDKYVAMRRALTAASDVQTKRNEFCNALKAIRPDGPAALALALVQNISSRNDMLNKVFSDPPDHYKQALEAIKVKPIKFYNPKAISFKLTSAMTYPKLMQQMQAMSDVTGTRGGKLVHLCMSAYAGDLPSTFQTAVVETMSVVALCKTHKIKVIELVGYTQNVKTLVSTQMKVYDIAAGSLVGQNVGFTNDKNRVQLLRIADLIDKPKVASLEKDVLKLRTKLVNVIKSLEDQNNIVLIECVYFPGILGLGHRVIPHPISHDGKVVLVFKPKKVNVNAKVTEKFPWKEEQYLERIYIHLVKFTYFPVYRILIWETDATYTYYSVVFNKKKKNIMMLLDIGADVQMSTDAGVLDDDEIYEAAQAFVPKPSKDFNTEQVMEAEDFSDWQDTGGGSQAQESESDDQDSELVDKRKTKAQQQKADDFLGGEDTWGSDGQD